MEAVSLSRSGVGLSMAEPASARSFAAAVLHTPNADEPATVPNASAPPETASRTAPEARSQAAPAPPVSEDPPSTATKSTLGTDATYEWPASSANASGAMFQAFSHDAKLLAANRSAADPRDAAGGASGAETVGDVPTPMEQAPPRGDRPNLLLMVTDDLAASHIQILLQLYRCTEPQIRGEPFHRPRPVLA